MEERISILSKCVPNWAAHVQAVMGHVFTICLKNVEGAKMEKALFSLDKAADWCSPFHHEKGIDKQGRRE